MAVANPVDTASMTDLVFGVRGEAVPADYHDLLAYALVALLPWLADEPQAGIHGLRTAPALGGVALLPRRARLTLRVPQTRIADARRLDGATLHIGDAAIVLGDMRERPLVAARTVYSEFVSLGPDDEPAFVDALRVALDALDIAARHICGRRRSWRTGEAAIAGYPVALHDLQPPASLRVQQIGIGGERLQGCGLFVPHKLITGLE